jgi:beta-lactamase regulating signal transducer with metallopeptidase domain
MSGLPLDALFEALANGLWRGSLLAAAAALLLRFVKRTTAGERYAVWLAILTVIALAPMAEVAMRSMQPVEAAAPLVMVETTLPAADWTGPETAAEVAPRWQPWEVAAAPFLMLWLAVGALFAVRLGRRCLLACSLKRSSAAPERELAAAVEGWERDLTAQRVGSTRVSLSLRSPAAVGWLAPAVLLPESAETDIQGSDLEMLWRHEQAHVSRRDDWTQLLAEVCSSWLGSIRPLTGCAASWRKRENWLATKPY